MKVIKLDRRHKHSNKYSAALQFTKREFTKARTHWAYRDALQQLFGEATEYVYNDPSRIGSGRWVYNENYRVDTIKYRINLKDAQVITLLELMIPHD